MFLQALNGLEARPNTIYIPGLSKPTLQVGSSGAAVSDLQKKLNAAGVQVAVTGTFDESTKAAVTTFQFKVPGLLSTGIVDSATWAALRAKTPEQQAQTAGTVSDIFSSVTSFLPSLFGGQAAAAPTTEAAPVEEEGLPTWVWIVGGVVLLGVVGGGIYMLTSDKE
jgi:peptidoglycan hydrolase-like protein with peptidoglycan-binding domain